MMFLDYAKVGLRVSNKKGYSKIMEANWISRLLPHEQMRSA